MFHWFLNQGIIRHEEAFRTLLREAIEVQRAPIQLLLFSLADFLFPVASKADPELVAALIERIAVGYGRESAIEAVHHLISKASVCALPSARQGWRFGVAQALQKLGFDLRDAGLEPSDLQPDQERGNHSSPELEVSSATLGVDEAKIRTSLISLLRDLLSSEHDEAHIEWGPVITHLVQRLCLDDIQALLDLSEAEYRSAQIFAMLSEKLCDLGNAQAAWVLGERAVATSTPYGWNPRHDSGSRLAALKALVRANPEKARRLAYEVLVSDLNGHTDESWYYRNIAINLDDILPLLTDDMPLQAIWSSVEQYIHALFEGYSLVSDSPCDLDKDPLADTPANGIADLLVLHIDHYVHILAQSARYTCAKLLLEHDPAVQAALHNILKKSESYQECALMVLDAVSLREPDAVIPFREEIIDLQQTTNYAIRRTARVIAERIGCEVGQDIYRPYQIAAIYQLSVPPLGTVDLAGRGEISIGEVLSDSDDPVEIVSPFHLWVEFVAEEAQLPKANVFHRVVQTMEHLAPRSRWSAQGEKELRHVLDSTGLQLPYRRPRAAVARRALFHTIGELIDSRLLNEDSLRKLGAVLRFYDPAMIMAEPAPRPVCICPMSGIGKYWRVDEKWLEQIEEADHLGSYQSMDGHFVLAEETTLRIPDWGIPTEVRQRVICLSATTSSRLGDDRSEFFQRVTNGLFEEYPKSRLDVVPTPLIIRCEPHGYDSPGENWLALNPAIGYQLEWRLAKSGLFRWVNEEGQIMVESIWWVDGYVGWFQLHSDTEVGEGWLVLASLGAWDAMRSVMGNLKQMANVERSFYKDGRRLMRNARMESDV